MTFVDKYNNNIEFTNICYKGTIEQLKTLVNGTRRYFFRKKTNYIHHKNLYGENGFLLACRNNDIEMVKYLVNELNFDINSKNKNDYNGFLYACLGNNIEMVKYLVHELKFDINSNSKFGDNGFLLACRNNNIEMVKYLVEELEIYNNSWKNKSIKKEILDYLEKNRTILENIKLIRTTQHKIIQTIKLLNKYFIPDIWDIIIYYYSD